MMIVLLKKIVVAVAFSSLITLGSKYIYCFEVIFTVYCIGSLMDASILVSFFIASSENFIIGSLLDVSIC